MRESLGCIPTDFLSFRDGQRRHHMQPFAAGGLAEADETEFVETVADFTRGFDNGGEGDIRARIEIEHQPAWNLRLPGQFHG